MHNAFLICWNVHQGEVEQKRFFLVAHRCGNVRVHFNVVASGRIG